MCPGPCRCRPVNPVFCVLNLLFFFGARSRTEAEAIISKLPGEFSYSERAAACAPTIHLNPLITAQVPPRPAHPHRTRRAQPTLSGVD